MPRKTKPLLHYKHQRNQHYFILKDIDSYRNGREKGKKQNVSMFFKAESASISKPGTDKTICLLILHNSPRNPFRTQKAAH